MKLSLVVHLIGGALSLAGAAVSQLSGCAAVAVTAIPTCAQSCYLDGAPTIGCAGLDFECQCSKQAALFAAIESCVAESCEASEYEKVIDGAAKVCECAVAGAIGGFQTVSGTVVPIYQTVGSFYPSGTVVPNPGSGSGSPPPTTASPPQATATTVTAGVGCQAASLGLVLSVVSAVLALAVL
ncbi:hypothetical protein B0H67DRAFT_639550 [Lasiosphaeris hirsuta]|uniref:CFEM domain-containing protein n=1 Tax=Lasiosphaeris hirsuta TaxID=260670 RepID=A0AA40BBF3_9PEZI|nr:hypothetical protein B0H67DRAFT_639550 [Lasiosphaeris hirsuta]